MLKEPDLSFFLKNMKIKGLMIKQLLLGGI